MPRRHPRRENNPENASEARPPQSAQTLIDPYAVLGLTRQASLDDIKKAYFGKVREFPPERHPEMFKKIHAAYEMLRTSEAKAATDLFLPHPPGPFVGAASSKLSPTLDLNFRTSDWAVLLTAFSDLGQTDFRSDFREVEG